MLTHRVFICSKHRFKYKHTSAAQRTAAEQANYWGIINRSRKWPPIGASELLGTTLRERERSLINCPGFYLPFSFSTTTTAAAAAAKARARVR